MSEAPSLFPSIQTMSPCPPAHDSSLILTNPHNTNSIRSLTALKIVDRLSCYAVGFSQADATKTRLTAMFHQFGEITSIRIIQNRKPFEIYMRFSTEAAALSAIAWCNDPTAHDVRARLSANHGYNKYCIKFINNKQCRKENCPNQHQWVSPGDILERPKQKPTQPCRQPPPPQAHSPHPHSPHANGDHFKEAALDQPNLTWIQPSGLQQRFSMMQSRFSQQNSMVQALLNQVNQLKLQNEALRSENRSMIMGRAASVSSKMSAPPKKMQPKRVSGDSEAFMGGDADMGELVDFVISNNAPMTPTPTLPAMPKMPTVPTVPTMHTMPAMHHHHIAAGAYSNKNYAYGGNGAYGAYGMYPQQAQAQAPPQPQMYVGQRHGSAYNSH